MVPSLSLGSIISTFLTVACMSGVQITLHSLKRLNLLLLTQGVFCLKDLQDLFSSSEVKRFFVCCG